MPYMLQFSCYFERKGIVLWRIFKSGSKSRILIPEQSVYAMRRDAVLRNGSIY
jgi:hypothetical protein